MDEMGEGQEAGTAPPKDRLMEGGGDGIKKASRNDWL